MIFPVILTNVRIQHRKNYQDIIPRMELDSSVRWNDMEIAV